MPHKLFVRTENSNDYLTAWRPTEPDDGRRPGERAMPNAPPPPCHDDNNAMQHLTGSFARQPMYLPAQTNGRRAL